MSAKKFESVDSFQQQITVDGRQSRLELSAESVVIHKSGVEFRSGVVIACSGSKHTGYHVSLVFTGMSKQAQSRLNLMAHSALGAG
jgi:hypothetical protein